MAIPLFVLQNNSRSVFKQRKLLENLSDAEIRKNCGLDVHGVIDILDIFQPLEGKRSDAIPVETKVITFLSYLRSGGFQWALGTLAGHSQSSACRIINACVDRLLEIAPEHIDFPSDASEIATSKLKLASLCASRGFPNILGLVDGTHVGIIRPHKDEHIYVNRKHYHSINCQLVTDSDYRILDVVARWPGSTHDSTVWKQSSVRGRLIRGDLGSGWFVGDSGYPLEPWLLTPFQEPSSEAEATFNRSLKITRSCVERAIGNWKSRFRAFCKTGGLSCYPEDKVCRLVVASIVLHNIFINRRIPLLSEDEWFSDHFAFPFEQYLRRHLATPPQGQLQLASHASDTKGQGDGMTTLPNSMKDLPFSLGLA